jgi:hypothetical protein
VKGNSETAITIWHLDAAVDVATELLLLNKVGQFKEAWTSRHDDDVQSTDF